MYYRLNCSRILCMLCNVTNLILRQRPKLLLFNLKSILFMSTFILRAAPRPTKISANKCCRTNQHSHRLCYMNKLNTDKTQQLCRAMNSILLSWRKNVKTLHNYGSKSNGAKNCDFLYELSVVYIAF